MIAPSPPPPMATPRPPIPRPRWSSTCDGSRRALGLKLIRPSLLASCPSHGSASGVPQLGRTLRCRRQMESRATLHVIREGSIDGDHVSSTVSLILDGDARLVVDPGMVPNRRLIVEALARLGVQPEAVT